VSKIPSCFDIYVSIPVKLAIPHVTDILDFYRRLAWIPHAIDLYVLFRDSLRNSISVYTPFGQELHIEGLACCQYSMSLWETMH